MSVPRGFGTSGTGSGRRSLNVRNASTTEASSPNGGVSVHANSNNAELVENFASGVIKALQSVNISEIMKGAGGGSSSASGQNLLSIGLGIGLGIGMKASGVSSTSTSKQTEDDPAESESLHAIRTRTLMAVPETTSPVDDSKSPSRSRKASLMGVRKKTPRLESVSNRRATALENMSPKSRKRATVLMTPTPDMTEYSLHAPAGEGTAFQRSDAKKSKALLASKPELPEGFLQSVYGPRTGKQHTDYLPQDDNLNEASNVGTVKPRSVLEDWMETGYDPWSEGKEASRTDFIPDIEDTDPATKNATLEKYGGTASTSAETRMAERIKQDEEKDKMMEELFSLARHGRYMEIEKLVLSPDWMLSIDEKDKNGNTLLHVAAQNGNKRIAKLALRQGANINEQNLNGNTVLHYCYAYDNEKLAEYLMSKGARDDILNASGMTCYEHLSMEDLEAL